MEMWMVLEGVANEQTHWPACIMDRSRFPVPGLENRTVVMDVEFLLECFMVDTPDLIAFRNWRNDVSAWNGWKQVVLGAHEMVELLSLWKRHARIRQNLRLIDKRHQRSGCELD